MVITKHRFWATRAGGDGFTPVEPIEPEGNLTIGEAARVASKQRTLEWIEQNWVAAQALKNAVNAATAEGQFWLEWEHVPQALDFDIMREWLKSESLLMEYVGPDPVITYEIGVDGEIVLDSYGNKKEASRIEAIRIKLTW